MKKLLLAIFLLAARALAVTEDAPVGVAVKLYAQGYDTSGNVTLSGTFLESSPGANDAYASATASVSGGVATAILGSAGYVRVEPGKSYILSAGGTAANKEVDIVAPPGYRVIMDHLIRSRETYTSLANIEFQLLPLGARHPGLAGMASSVAGAEIEWRLSLGALRNGGSAGDLALIDTGTEVNWFNVFTPAALYYEEVSDEVTVYRPNNTIRQIIANQVVVDIVTTSSTAYEIRCYHPDQMLGSTNPRAFSGSPYALYRIEEGTSATALKFTKEIRNVDAANLNAPVSRREIMTLERTGTWPAFTWTRRDWTVEGQTALTETVVTGGGTTANRTETIAVHAPGAGTNTLNLTRSYTVPLNNNVSTIGEVLAAETVGTSTGLNAAFNYYTDPTDFGSLGYLKSATLPGGKWVAFDYYPANLASGYRGGRLKYRYEPYLTTPATVAQTPGQGQVTYFEYVNDIFGAPVRPSLVQTTVNGTIVAKSTTTYNDSALTANGFPIAQSTRSDYADATNNLQTTVRYYRDDTSDAFVRGQTYSVTAPDGVKQSFAYKRGTWNATNLTFTPGAGYIGTGTASKITVVTGSASSAAGVACASIDGYDFDQVYLVDGKSTMDVTIRDNRALVVRTESYLRKSGDWQRVSFTNYTYDYAGRLLTRTSSNGATYTAAYDGGLKTTETDEAGVITDYTYDAADQVSIATREGVGVIGALATKFTYDALGHVTETRVGWGQTEQIVSAQQYDDAGRVTVEAPPGNYGAVTHSYDAANRRHTITRQTGGGALTEEDYLDGRLYAKTGTATIAEYHTYGVEPDGRTWHQVNSGLNPNVTTSPRWSKAWKDWLGRDSKSQHPGFTGQPDIISQSFYENGTGHLIKTTTTGYNSATLYHYNILGQVDRSGLDYDNNGTLDLAGSDRITDTDSYLEAYNNAWWMRTDTKVYPKLGLNTVVLTSISRTRLTGHPANRLSETIGIDAEGNTTTQVVDVDRTNRTSTATTTRSGIANAMVETTVNGFSRTITSFDGLTVTKGYDALLRPNAVTDSRGNTTTTAYISGTQRTQTVTDAAGDVATTSYDAVGRVQWTRDPKNISTFFEYNPRDQLVHQWGDGTIPVEYGYDATYGDRTTMSTFRGGTGWGGTTWPTSPGTADTTSWTYDGPSGLLVSKKDAPTPEHPSGMAVTQTYNARGQTLVRTLARGVTTTYGYDNATGELLSQTYSDSTPAVGYTYGRTGQVETVADFTGVRDLVYDPNKPWRLTAEAESAFYGNRVLTRMYDESGVIGRVRGFQLGAAAGSNADLEQTFGFTTVGRFETIASKREANSASRTFRYGYLANSALLQSVAIDQGAGPGGHPFTITRTYEDHRDLITAIDSKWSTASVTKYVYAYDERGQRTSALQSGTAFGDYGDSTFRLFGYDGRGEVTSDIAYLGSSLSDTSKPLPGRRHEYGYDNAGNRAWSNRTGVDALKDHYTTNALNQYVSRENNTLPLSGTAEPDTGGAGGTAVTVTGGAQAPVAAGRQGRYWDSEIAVNNVLAPWRGALTIFTAKRGSGGSADLFKLDSRMAQIAAVLQSFVYDQDGNLTSDGVVDYQWDAENRLIRMETSSVAQSYNFPHRVLEFRYDYMGRRVQKRVLDADQSPAAEIYARRFLYDGWNLVAEYNAPGGTSIGSIVRSYTWGLDIALSMSNAGGVGALLQIADHPSGKTYLPTYDGNGNIASLVNADSGALAAIYEYSPFGEPLRAQTLDATIADNPWRFSTKWTDLETGLVYYGHRYYDPRNGRFINRDPIEEQGGLNLYGFCGNDGVNGYDVLGHGLGINLTNLDLLNAQPTSITLSNVSVTNASSVISSEPITVNYGMATSTSAVSVNVIDPNAPITVTHAGSATFDTVTVGNPGPSGSTTANAGVPLPKIGDSAEDWWRSFMTTELFSDLVAKYCYEPGSVDISGWSKEAQEYANACYAAQAQSAWQEQYLGYLADFEAHQQNADDKWAEALAEYERMVEASLANLSSLASANDVGYAGISWCGPVAIQTIEKNFGLKVRTQDEILALVGSNDGGMTSAQIASVLALDKITMTNRPVGNTEEFENLAAQGYVLIFSRNIPQPRANGSVDILGLNHYMAAIPVNDPSLTYTIYNYDGAGHNIKQTPAQMMGSGGSGPAHTPSGQSGHIWVIQPQ